MARCRKHRKEMSLEFVHLLLITHIFQNFIVTVETFESQSQAFIQTDNHLTYIVGDDTIIPIEVGQSFVEINSIDDENFISSAIGLDPPMLDFLEQHVGMPRMEQVTLQNTDSKNTIHLLSISGSTVHFHCSFFQEKTVPPGGNTTFDVVFLPRQVGNVENTLYIHTSVGSFKYQVFGVGTPNPYRLRPYLGAKVPLNSSFSPLIKLHNPHSSTLQVVEMFSSEGNLHLELPSGEKEAPKRLWEIPPYETKQVMKANFIGREEKNHTAFIRIKTNQEENNQLLILPMEVEVSSLPGLYTPVELIEFGILRTLDDPKTVPLTLVNTGVKSVQISSVLVSPPNDAVSIEFRPIKLPADMRKTTVAHITFKASKALNAKQWSGKILIRTKNNQHRLTIPYQATVLHGSLSYNPENLYFHCHHELMYFDRPIPFTNTFNFSIVIYNVTVPPEMRFYFTINNFSEPVVIHPQQTVTPFVLHFHPDMTLLHFDTHITIHTNASDFTIPLIVFNGLLKKTGIINMLWGFQLADMVWYKAQQNQFTSPYTTPYLPAESPITYNVSLPVHDLFICIVIYDHNGFGPVIQHRPEKFKGRFDFGTLGIGEQRSIVFTLRNDNPVEVWFRELSTTLNGSSIELLGVEKGNGTTLTRTHNKTLFLFDDFILKPYHYAVLSLNLFAPPYESTFAAELMILTVYEDLFIPVYFKTADGTLTAVPEKLVFERVFPGKTVFKVLQIHSTFKDFMEVIRVSFNPEDLRFRYEPQNEFENIVLQSNEHNIVGKIYFDAKKECDDDCYVGLPTSTPAGHQWLLGLTLDKEVADTDQYLFTKLQQRWDKVERNGLNTANVTLELDTNHVKGFLFSAQAYLHWPSLVKKSKIRFPLTQIGNTSFSDFIIENSGDMPVLIQILPLSLYPNPQTIIGLLNKKFSYDLTDLIETDDLDIFTLSDLELHNKKTQNPIPDHRLHVENSLGVKPHSNTIAAILNSGVKMKIRVGFHPKDDASKTSLILIRNNLTIIDSVILQGQGGRGDLRFSSRKPGSLSPLLFDMTEKHLKYCDTSCDKQSKDKKNKSMIPHFTVKRTFTLRNTGELPFYVKGFSINDLPCEGYGFKLLDCEGFDMPPNTSRKIDIAFTPDFTMSRIRRILTMYTTLGPPINFTLQATVPPHTLSKCSAALPRPNWEPVLYYSILCVMGFLLFCILVASHFEADRIYVADILKRKLKMCSSAQTFDKSKIFDLKSIGDPSPPVNCRIPSSTVDMKKPVVKQVDLIPNGHIEYKERKKKSLVSGIMGLLKGLFSLGNSQVIKREQDQPPLNTSIEKPLKQSNSPGVVPSSTSPKLQSENKSNPPVTQEVFTAEKSLTSHRGKKSKAAKRHNSDLTNNESSHSHKPSSTENKKTSKAHHNTDNRKTDQEKPKSAEIDRQQFGSKYPPLDFDKIEFDDYVSQFKGKGSNSKNKTKTDKENFKDKLFMKDVDERDETSSTTTDSSSTCMDIEDKNSSARESTPDIPIPKPKRNKPKMKAKSSPDDRNIEEDEFEITSRSKAHRKFRNIPKDAYGGNIHRPSSLELPYSLEVKETTDVDSSDPPKSKKAKSSKNKPKGFSFNGSVDLSDNSKDSPSPCWDMPYSPRAPGDLSELSIQTEQFAQKVYKSAGNGLSPDGLSSSSRSSSYSSIVSNSSGEMNGKGKNGLKQPVMDTKRPSGNFSPEIIPGVIGSKTPGKISPVSTSGIGWPTTSVPATTDSMSGFGLQPIQETTQVPGLETGYNNFTQAELFGPNGENGFQFGGSNMQSRLQPSMMQRLQADRRRRILEHQIKAMKGEEWPGFNVPAVRSDSLWDDFSPLDPAMAWSTNTDTPVRPPAGLWNTLTNSANSSWNSLMSIWASQQQPGNISPEAHKMMTEEEPPVSNPQQSGSPGFGPFSNMMDIWGPNTRSGATGTGWNYQNPQEEMKD